MKRIYREQFCGIKFLIYRIKRLLWKSSCQECGQRLGSKTGNNFSDCLNFVIVFQLTNPALTSGINPRLNIE